MQDYEEKHRETEKQGERIPGTLTHPRKSGTQKGILGKKKYRQMSSGELSSGRERI